MKTQVHEISIASVMKIIGLFLLLWFVWFIRDILAMVFVSIIIAAAMSPSIDRIWRKTKIPRWLSVLFFYTLFILAVGGFIYFVFPPLIIQIRQLANQLPNYFPQAAIFFDYLQNFQTSSDLLNTSQDTLNSFSNFLDSIFGGVVAATTGVVNGAVAFITIMILTLYFLLDENGIKNFFVSLVPVKQKTRVVDIFQKIGIKLGHWIRGQIILGVIMGIIVYVGLTIMKVPFALTLALLIAVFEIIPIIGPILAAIPAILIALSISPSLALIVLLFYIIAHQIENNLLVPKIMQHSVGLNPITIIIILLIGAKLMGIIGMLLAVPIATVFYTFLQEWLIFQRRKRA